MPRRQKLHVQVTRSRCPRDLRSKCPRELRSKRPRELRSKLPRELRSRRPRELRSWLFFQCIISRANLFWKSVSHLRGDWAATTAHCTGLIKAPQIWSNGERVGKWFEERDQDGCDTIGSEAKKRCWRQHPEERKRGWDMVKGELWCYVIYIEYFM